MESNITGTLTHRLTTIRDRLQQSLTTKFEVQTYTTLTVVRQVTGS